MDEAGAAGMRARWRARRACHGHIACCQYVDTAQCNSWNDPHLLWRLCYRAGQRWEIFKDERAGR